MGAEKADISQKRSIWIFYISSCLNGPKFLDLSTIIIYIIIYFGKPGSKLRPKAKLKPEPMAVEAVSHGFPAAQLPWLGLGLQAEPLTLAHTIHIFSSVGIVPTSEKF